MQAWPWCQQRQEPDDEDKFGKHVTPGRNLESLYSGRAEVDFVITRFQGWVKLACGPGPRNARISSCPLATCIEKSTGHVRPPSLQRYDRFGHHQPNQAPCNLCSSQTRRLCRRVVSRRDFHDIRANDIQPDQPIKNGQKLARGPAARLSSARGRGKGLGEIREGWLALLWCVHVISWPSTYLPGPERQCRP